MFSSKTGEILSLFCPPIFSPSPSQLVSAEIRRKVRAWHRVAWNRISLPSFRIIFLFIRPKNGAFPAHQATCTQESAACPEIDLYQLSSRTIPCIHTWMYILRYYLLFVFVSLSLPQLKKKKKIWVTATEPKGASFEVFFLPTPSPTPVIQMLPCQAFREDVLTPSTPHLQSCPLPLCATPLPHPAQ